MTARWRNSASHKSSPTRPEGSRLNFANLLISQWLLRLYVPSIESALVAPALFGFIFLVGRIVDGVTDPLTGYLSDRLRSRWGRRKPFIACALLPTALVSALMWFPPHPGGASVINGIFIFVLVQLFFIFWTLLANPYMSLIPELTTNIKERVDITTLQAVFLMIGTLLSAVIGNIKEAAGWGGLGVTVGVLTIVSFLPTLLFIREKPTNVEPAAPGEEGFGLGTMASWIGTTFRNPPFILLLASTSFFWFALNTKILLIPFWVEHVTGRGDADVIWIMLPYIVANVSAFVPFNLAAKKWGKQAVFLFSLALSGLATVSLTLVGLLPVDPFLHTQAVMALYGISTSGFLMLPNALLADVVDFDAAQSGKRREAIHFGVQAFFQKVAIGLSIVVSAALMYIGSSNEPTVFGLKTVAASSGIAALLSAGIFFFYPLRDKK